MQLTKWNGSQPPGQSGSKGQPEKQRRKVSLADLIDPAEGVEEGADPIADAANNDASFSPKKEEASLARRGSAVAEDAQCTRMIKCSSARAGRARHGVEAPLWVRSRLYS